MKSSKIGIGTLAGMAALAIGSTPAYAGADPFIGEIQAFPYQFCPRGWAEADGRLLQIRDHTALFSLLGTVYGGDGRTTFGLPDLRAKAGKNTRDQAKLRHCIALVGIYPSRN